MPISLATKLGIQFARFAAASGNVGSAGLRGTFGNATAGSSSGASSSWAQGLSSGPASNGAGLGGAKFQAGRGAHSTFSHSGRAIVNANGTSSHDGSTSIGDDEEEIAAHQAWIHRPGQLHRSSIDFRRPHSPSQRTLSSSRSRYDSTTIPALQLTLPQKTQLLITPASPQQARALATSARASTPSSPSPSSAAASDTPSLVTDLGSEQSSAPSTTHRRRHVRSRSLDTIADPKEASSALDIPSILAPRRQRRGWSNASKGSVDGNEQTSEKQASGVREVRKSEDGAEMDLLEEAMRSFQDTSMLLAARRYLDLDPSKTSVAGYRKAVRALYLAGKSDGQDMSTIHQIIEAYERMIANDIRPDLGTYTLVLQALCHRDRRLLIAIQENELHHKRSGKVADESNKSIHEVYRQEADGHFAKALSIFYTVHTATPGFHFPQPYIEILFSCQLRGSAKQACDILERLAGNHRVRADGNIFASLIKTLLADTQTLPGETAEEKGTRRFTAIRQVFDEFEARRAAPDWVHFKGDGKVWDAMIVACFACGHPAIAMELLEGFSGSVMPNVSKDAAPAPFPTRRTTNNIIRGLIAQDDLVSAYAWVDRLIKLHAVVDQGEASAAFDSTDANEDGDLDASDGASNRDEQAVDFSARPPMPPPGLVVLCSLINATTHHVRVESDSVKHVVQEKLPLVEAANRVISYMFTKFEQSKSSNRLPMIHGSLVNLLRVNSFCTQELIAQGRRAEADRYLDTMLSFIHSYFKFDWLERLDGDGKLSPKAVKRNTRISHEIGNVFRGALLQGRVQDAASLLTYALESSLNNPEAFRAVPQEERENVEEIGRKLVGLFHLLCGAEKLGSHTTLQRLYAIADIAMPAFKANGFSDLLSTGTSAHIMRVYSEARQEIEAAQMPLSVVGWNEIIDTCTLWTKRKVQAEHPSEDYLHILLADLATLPESVRLQLDVDGLAKLALQQSPSTLTDVVKAINPKLPALHDPFEEARKRDSIDGETATPPPDIASLLEGTTIPPAGAGVDVWPAVQTLDEDLSSQIMRGAVRRGGGTPVKELYANVLRSVVEAGSYPTLQGVCKLLTVTGRVGDTTLVHAIYSLGAQVVSSMTSNPDWQMFAWAQLERAMISGLAHSGDAMGASEHRHRMLKAGQIPDADAYAALISVVRDTTDDAMVAEELFEESKRLNVKPTVYLFNTVISKLCRARKIERAMQLFDELRRHNLTPSSVTYGALINGCARTGEEQNAESLFAMMEVDPHFRPNAPPFNTMMQFYTYTKPNRQKVLSYYQKMQKFNVPPTEHTYKVLLDMYGTIEPVDVAGMEHIFGLLIADSNANVQGTHWSSILTAHGIQRGDLDKTIALFDSIPNHIATHRAGAAKKKGNNAKTDKAQDAVTYEALLNVCLSHNRVDMMQHYIERMRASGIHPTAYVGNLVMRGLAAQAEHAGEETGASVGGGSESVPHGLAQARALFEEMKDPPMGIAAAGNHPPNHRHHANGDVLTSAASKSAEAEAETTTKSNGAVTESFGFDGVLREPSTFNTMIRLELNHGNREAALRLVERMQQRGYPPALLAKAYMMLESEVPAAAAQSMAMAEGATMVEASTHAA